jgi:hypothetical protein
MGSRVDVSNGFFFSVASASFAVKEFIPVFPDKWFSL